MAGVGAAMGTHADYFLKVDGIEGEATSDGHKNEIDVLSFSYGVTQPGSAAYAGPGSGVGRAQFHDVSITKYMDKASPKLMQACAGGDHKATVVLTARRAGGSQQDYLEVKLSQVLFSNYQVSGGGGDSLPVESLTLNYAKIEFSYWGQDEKGNKGAVTKSGWDIAANKKV
jgi:type VI secretion system secreted protein Hcp